MSFIDQLLSRLFPERNKNTAHLPVFEEALRRSDTFRQDYFRWLNEGMQKKMIFNIREAWLLKQKNEPHELAVHLLQTNGSNGIAISHHPGMDAKALCYLFDYLKDRALNLGYKLYTSDRRVFDKNDYVETVEKHYLKPPSSLTLAPDDQPDLCDQRYGNLLLEYFMINDRPSFMRLMVHYYDDRLYTKALPFDTFMEELLA